MEMSYYFSGTIYNFLFSGVNVVTTWGMVSLCMGLACLSLLGEGFKVARSLLLKVATAPHGTSCDRYNTSERVKFHILQTFLHIIHLTIGYLLMLAVMTYNAYLTIAVVVGAGIGYYCFALFDLPSKVLGTIKYRPAKWSADTHHLSEDDSSKQTAEDVNVPPCTSEITMHLGSVLQNDMEREEHNCLNEIDKKNIQSLHLQDTSLIHSTDGH